MRRAVCQLGKGSFDPAVNPLKFKADPSFFAKEPQGHIQRFPTPVSRKHRNAVFLLAEMDGGSAVRREDNPRKWTRKVAAFGGVEMPEVVTKGLPSFNHRKDGCTNEVFAQSQLRYNDGSRRRAYEAWAGEFSTAELLR